METWLVIGGAAVAAYFLFAGRNSTPAPVDVAATNIIANAPTYAGGTIAAAAASTIATSARSFVNVLATPPTSKWQGTPPVMVQAPAGAPPAVPPPGAPPAVPPPGAPPAVPPTTALASTLLRYPTIGTRKTF